MDPSRRRLVSSSAAAVGALGLGVLGAPAGAAVGRGGFVLGRQVPTTTPGLEGDIWLDVPVYSGGEVEGGVIRRATSLLVPWSYTQTDAPADDRAIGTAVSVDWQATLLDNTAWVGPRAQTGFFGPRGVFHIEGEVRYGNNMSRVNLTPIAYGNQLFVSNTDGANRTVTPGWGFMNAPWFLARDGRTLTLERNDTANGMGGFVDNQLYAVDPEAPGGTIDGATNGYEAHSFVVRTFVTEGVHLAGVVGFDMCDVNGIEGHLLPGPVPAVGQIDRTVGVRVAHLSRGGTFGVGVENGSRTINPPQVAVVDATGDGLRTDATVVVVDNATGSAIALTSTTALPAGEDGQVVTLVGSGTAAVTVPGTDELAGSTLAGETRTIAPGDALDLVWHDDAWRPRAPLAQRGRHGSIVASVGGAVAHGSPSLTFSRTGVAHPTLVLGHYLGAPVVVLGTGSAAPDAALIRAGAGALGVGGSPSGGVVEAGIRRPINAQTGTAYTVAATDRAVTIVRDNAAASTQTWPRDSAAADLAIGTEVPVCNRGAGAITHQAGAGATVIVAGPQPAATRWVGVKVAADTWLVG